MDTAIVPEVVGLTTVLEESPMTDEEQKELVIVKTAIKTAYADKLERDLAIGAGLLKIFRRKLYRGKKGGRTWEQWLSEESAELTSGRGPIDQKTSEYLRGFYQFRVEMLQPQSPGSAKVALPTSPKQIRPLLGQLNSHPVAALQMWKSACAEAGKGKVPTFDQVSRAASAYKANEENEAFRLSPAHQAALKKAVAASRYSAVTSERKEQQQAELPPPSFNAPAPTIPAWELEKDDSSLDAGAECRKVWQLLQDCSKAISCLRGQLYSATAKYGSSYLQFLREVDAGVYSISAIDHHLNQLIEDLQFVQQLLDAEYDPGELTRNTIDVSQIPTRA